MARLNLIYEGTFEGAAPFNGINSASSTPDEISQSTDFARAGTHSSKIILNKTDADVGGSKRSEMNRSSTSEPSGNFERWYGISFYLPASWAIDTAPEVICQWHEYSSTASPHFALWSLNGHFWIAYDGIATVDLGPYTLSVWTDFVFHMNWDTTAAGNFNAWMNGVQVVTNKVGANMPVDTHGPYWKCGVYKWYWKKYPTLSQTTQRIIYIDELREGSELATYNDVVPEQSLNVPPTVEAGNPKIIIQPTSSTILSSIGANGNGTITGYTWTKTNGPAGDTIVSPNSAITVISGLSTVGTYSYKITVVDNNGLNAFDSVNIYVTESPQEYKGFIIR